MSNKSSPASLFQELLIPGTSLMTVTIMMSDDSLSQTHQSELICETFIISINYSQMYLYSNALYFRTIIFQTKYYIFKLKNTQIFLKYSLYSNNIQIIINCIFLCLMFQYRFQTVSHILKYQINT